MNAISLVRTAALAVTLAVAATPAAAQLQLPRPSQKATVTQTIGRTDVTVVYSRPGVKGRVIWGSLVPYDEPWRTGANEATSFTCSEDVTVEGRPLAAGTYSLMTIPGRETWTVVFNREKDLWGAYAYKPESDALRVEVKPQAGPHEEWMSFRFDDPSWEGATLTLRWEALAVPVRIGVDDVAQCMVALRDTLGRAPADDWRTPFRAASFCLDAGVNLDEGAKWAEASVAIEPGYYNTGVLARYRAQQGKTDEAIATATKAIEIGRAAKNDVRPMELLIESLKKR